MKTLQELLALFNSAKSSLADLLKAQIDGENGDARPLSQETQERISFAYLLRDDIEYLMAQDSPDLQQIFLKLNLMISFIGNITAATQVYSSYTTGSGIVFLPGIGGSERYATNSIYGIVRLSVPAVIANAPIAVGDNDPRLSNSSEAYNDTIVGAALNTAGQLVLTKRDASTITTSGSNILNNQGSAQAGGFWISGDGIVEGDIVMVNLANNLSPNQFAVFDGQNKLQYISTAQLQAVVGIGSLTASRALVTDGSGDITTSSVTASEVSNLLGSTSNLQTQINNKQPLDADLTAIAALTGNGLLRKTSGTWGMDTNTYLTANQTITLTGPITGSGSTTIATTITNNSVGLSKLAAINTSRLLGRSTALSGNVEELTIGTGLSLSAGALSSTITQYTDAMARLAISETITGITYDNTTGVFSLTAGYVIPTTTEETNWNTAYTNRITSLTTTGSSGASTLVSNVLNIPTYTLAGLGGQPLATNLTSLSGLTYVSASFVKMTASGTFTLDTNTYITGNQTITLSGDVTGSGTTAITTAIANDAVTFAKMQNVSTGILLGRSTASSGNVEEIAIGSGLVLSAGTLNLGTITASRAVVTNVSGVLEASTTTATQIGYLSTLSSNAQTQIDGKQPLDATLTALAAFGSATPGIMVLSGADTFVTRILEGTSNRISVNNASGSGTNPSIDIASTYAGQSTITTVGTITVGAWNGSSIADGYIVSAANWNEAYDEKINSLGFNTSTGILTGTQQDGGTVTASLDGRYLLLAGGTMTGYLTLNGDPVNNLHAATKQYVDNIATGIKPKGSVSAATTGTLPSYTGATQTLTGTSNGALAAQDGVTLVLGDYLLVKNEAGANEKYNGIYEVTQVGDGSNPYELTRISTANTWAEIVNATIYVAGGSTLQGYTYYQTSPSGGTLGTTAIIFVVFSISTVYLEGSGIDITGNTISIATGGIVDSMISASASITLSKLASVTANKVLISDGSGYVSASTVTNTEIGYVSGVTSAIQTQINAKQPLDATLTALAAFNSNGIMVQTAADTFTSRTITGTSNRLDVTNGSGVGGDPTLDISASYVGQASITTLGTIATGTWQGTAVADGYIASASNWNAAYNNMVVSAAFNTSDGVLTLTQQDAGTVTVDLDGRYLLGNETITLSGQATGSGTTAITVTLDNAAVIGKVLTGYVSGAGTVASTDTILQAIQKLNGNIGAIVSGVSSVSGTTDRIAVSPTSGAVVVDIASTYAGQSTITTLGTITTGVWNGTAIANSYIGTGIDATKIADGSVTNAEFQYINSLTSNAQTQIDAKQAGSTNLTSLSGLTYASTSFVKMTASGTFALDTNTYVNTSSISGTSGTVALFGASNSLGNSKISQVSNDVIVDGGLFINIPYFLGRDGIGNNRFVLGFDSGISGGSTTDINMYTYGNNNYFISTNGSKRIQVTGAGSIITNGASAATGEHFIIGGSARVNGAFIINGNALGINTFTEYKNDTTTLGYVGSAAAIVTGGSATNLAIGTNAALIFAAGSGYGEAARISSARNFLIGTTTDDGVNKLQVSGSGYFSSSLTATSFIKSGSSNSDFLLGGGGTVAISTYLTTATAASTYQPLDATLTALAGLNTTAGVLVQTGTDTFTKRTITAGTGMVVTNGSGVSGNPTIAIDTTLATATAILNQAVSAQTADFWISGTAKINTRVYIGTHGCYIEEVEVGTGNWELVAYDSNGNATVFS